MSRVGWMILASWADALLCIFAAYFAGRNDQRGRATKWWALLYPALFLLGLIAIGAAAHR